MLHWIAGFALAFVPVDEAAVKEVGALAQKVKDAESYTFTFKPAAKEKDDEKDAGPWKVEIKRKLPFHYTHGEVEFFKADEHFIFKGKDGKWTAIDPAERAKHGAPKAGGAANGKKDDDGDDDAGKGGKPGREGKDGKEGKRGGGGGHPREGGGAGGGGAPGAAGEGGERRVGVERFVAASEMIPLPHRLFSDFASKVAEASKDEKDGKARYHIKLTPAAARELMGRNARAGKGGRGEGKEGKDGKDGKEGRDGEAAAAAGKEPEYSGMIHLSAKGDVVEDFELELTFKGPNNEHKSGGVIVLSNLNATNLVVPPEATAAMGGGAPEKK